MHPNKDASLIPADLFPILSRLFLILYIRLLRPNFLPRPSLAALPVISGVDMFINQAVLQFERFTGVNAPIEVMRRVVMKHLGS